MASGYRLCVLFLRLFVDRAIERSSVVDPLMAGTAGLWLARRVAAVATITLAVSLLCRFIKHGLSQDQAHPHATGREYRSGMLAAAAAVWELRHPGE
jgi:hypothetical protein